MDYSTPTTIKCRTLNSAWRVVRHKSIWCNETDTLTRNWNYGLENVLTTWKPNTNEKRKRGKLQTRGYSQWRAAQLERYAMTSHQQAAWLLTYYWRSKRRRTHTTSDRNQSDCFQPKAMTSPRVTTSRITVNSRARGSVDHCQGTNVHKLPSGVLQTRCWKLVNSTPAIISVRKQRTKKTHEDQIKHTKTHTNMYKIKLGHS